MFEKEWEKKRGKNFEICRSFKNERVIWIKFWVSFFLLHYSTSTEEQKEKNTSNINCLHWNQPVQPRESDSHQNFFHVKRFSPRHSDSIFCVIFRVRDPSNSLAWKSPIQYLILTPPARPPHSLGRSVFRALPTRNIRCVCLGRTSTIRSLLGRMVNYSYSSSCKKSTLFFAIGSN